MTEVLLVTAMWFICKVVNLVTFQRVLLFWHPLEYQNRVSDGLDEPTQ